MSVPTVPSTTTIPNDSTTPSNSDGAQHLLFIVCISAFLALLFIFILVTVYCLCYSKKLGSTAATKCCTNVPTKRTASSSRKKPKTKKTAPISKSVSGKTEAAENQVLEVVAVASSSSTPVAQTSPFLKTGKVTGNGKALPAKAGPQELPSTSDYETTVTQFTNLNATHPYAAAAALKSSVKVSKAAKAGKAVKELAKRNTSSTSSKGSKVSSSSRKK